MFASCLGRWSNFSQPACCSYSHGKMLFPQSPTVWHPSFDFQNGLVLELNVKTVYHQNLDYKPVCCWSFCWSFKVHSGLTPKCLTSKTVWCWSSMSKQFGTQVLTPNQFADEVSKSKVDWHPNFDFQDRLTSKTVWCWSSMSQQFGTQVLTPNQFADGVSKS